MVTSAFFAKKKIPLFLVLIAVVAAGSVFAIILKTTNPESSDQIFRTNQFDATLPGVNSGGTGPQGNTGGTTGGSSVSCDQAAQQQGHANFQAFCGSQNLCPNTSSSQCECTPCLAPTLPPGQTNNCTVSDSSLALDSEEQTMQNIINAYRQQNGLSSLPLSLTLTRASAWMSNDMASHNLFASSHIDSVGRNSPTRAVQCGYPAEAFDILAYNSSTDPNFTLTAWKNSPNHNMTILNQIANSGGGTPLQKNWASMGVGRASSGGQWFWTVYFGLTNDGGSVPTITQPTPTPVPTGTPTPTPQPTSVTPTQTAGTPSPTLGASPTPVPTIPAGSAIIMSLSLPGVGSNISVGENLQPVSQSLTGSVQIIDPTTQQPISSGDGLFIYNSSDRRFKGIGVFDPGIYIIKTRINNSLWKNLGTAEVKADQITNLNGALVTGDLNGDNKLDLMDYNIMLTCFGKKNVNVNLQSVDTITRAAVLVCSGAEPDLNLDGLVDEKDLNIFYSGLAKREGD